MRPVFKVSAYVALTLAVLFLTTNIHAQTATSPENAKSRTCSQLAEKCVARYRAFPCRAGPKCLKSCEERKVSCLKTGLYGDVTGVTKR